MTANKHRAMKILKFKLARQKAADLGIPSSRDIGLIDDWSDDYYTNDGTQYGRGNLKHPWKETTQP